MSWLENVQMLGEPALPASEGIICLDSNGATERTIFTAYSLSDIINTADKTVPYAFECIVAGTVDISEAAFIAVTAAGQTVVDGTATFISRDPTIWNYPMVTAERAINAYRDRLPGVKEIWMEKNHLESKPSSNMNIISTGNQFDEIPGIYRVDKTINEYSPTKTDGSSNNNFFAGSFYDIAITTDVYWYGQRFECGDAIQVLTSLARFEDCKLEYGTVNWPAGLAIKSDHVQFLNSDIISDQQQDQILSMYQSGHVKITFDGCFFNIASHANGFIQGADIISYQELYFNDCDMENFTNPILVDSSDFSLSSDTNADITRFELLFGNCHLPSGYTIWDGSWRADTSTEITVENCSDDGTNTYVNEHRALAGNIKYDDAAYYDAGYEDSESAARLSIVVTAESKASEGLTVDSPQIGGFFSVRGSKILTLELVENFTAPLNASEIWLELYYYKSNGDALHTLDKSTKEYVKATFTELPAGAGLGNWTGEPAGSRSVKLVTTISVNHPGLFYGVVKLGKYESGKVVHIDPEFQVS